ncbi:MAG TPA: S-layer homology domain-containing protein [Candidatus Ornithomonoglobus merdipullorum]|uniref:S-layer homology domain-containing protein n=1 Tax=Candidatus Ornithomonoglobus merdipullorum TaxID=2840895 RepID=A0A9D1MBX7_9FIRM|nr:S-layer homology domain-containing protein [Candidatus Ornithomonoglobus merdipullorum]
MKKIVSMIMMLVMMVCMLPSVNAADIASGEGNDGESWRLDSSGTLYISGQGETFLWYVGAPWYEYEPQIKHIVFEEGVTIIDNGIFTLPKYENLTITFPASLEMIGFYGEEFGYPEPEECDLIDDEWGLKKDVSFIVIPGTYAEDYVKRKGYNYTYSGQHVAEPVQEQVQSEPVQKNTVTTSFGATASDWAAPEIELAYESGLIPEVMVDFDLTQKVNRGEFAAIALQLYDVLENTETPLPASCPFTDIAGDVNEIAIKKAAGLDITNGTSPTLFEPLSNITREQLATMLCRVMKKHKFEGWTLETDDDYYLNTNGAVKFADDAEISDWAKPSVYFMSLFGIVKGIDETHFAPKNTTTQQEASGYATATREQALIMSKRIYDKADML